MAPNRHAEIAHAAPPASWRQLGRCRRGVTALEFALVGPFLMLLLLAIIENGLMMFAQAVLDNATIAAARQVQIGAISDSNGFNMAVCNNVSTFFTCAKLQIYVAGNASSFPAVVLPSSSGTLANSFSKGNGGNYMIAEVAYDRAYVSPWLFTLNPSGWVLLSVQAFQNEPFS